MVDIPESLFWDLTCAREAATKSRLRAHLHTHLHPRQACALPKHRAGPRPAFSLRTETFVLSSLSPSQARLPRPPLTSRATRDATRATKPTGTERFGGVDHAAAFLPEMTPWFRCLCGVKPSIAVKALAGRRLQRVAQARPPVRPSPRDDSRAARVGPARRRSCTPAGSCVWEAWWALAEPGAPGSGAGRKEARPGEQAGEGKPRRGAGCEHHPGRDCFTG